MKKVNKEKQLPIVLPPPIYYSLFAADKLSVIMLSKYAENWIYNNFIQLIFYMDNLSQYRKDSHSLSIWPVDSLKMDIAGANMFIREYYITDKIVQLTRDNIIDNIKSWIDKGLYVYGSIDVSKLEGTRYYNGDAFCHSALIIGYCDNFLYQVDFGVSGKLEILKIKNENFIDATFSDSLENILRNKKHINAKYNFILFERKDDYKSECKLDKNVIKIWVKSYLECSDCCAYSDFFLKRENIVSGLDVYDAIKNVVLQNFKKGTNIDYRMFHALYEHKLIMYRRILKLKNENIIQNCDDLEVLSKKILDQANCLRLYILKYNEQKNKKTGDQIIDYIDLINKNDENFMKCFYFKLD